MNAIDYTISRGDLSFEVSPFNEVDAMIFSLLAYYQAERLIKMGIEIKGSTLLEVSRVHREKIKREYSLDAEFELERDIMPLKFAPYIMSQLIETDRFKDVKIVDFVERFDAETVVQFAAYTFELPNGDRVLAYRGTDDSTVGWKEDCMLSFLPRIPGQEEAAKYASALEKNKRYYITGHSKGGNEAMYAYLYMDEGKVENILGVYNFDGPGFLHDVFEMERYKANKEKIHSFVPSSSVVGMLLKHTNDYTVVKSISMGVKQHNALFWQVRCTKFDIEKGNEWKRQVSEETFAKFLSELSIDDRRHITDSAFALLEKSGVRSFAQFSHSTKTLATVMKELMKLPIEERKKLRGAIKRLSTVWASSYIKLSPKKAKVEKSKLKIKP